MPRVVGTIQKIRRPAGVQQMQRTSKIRVDRRSGDVHRYKPRRREVHSVFGYANACCASVVHVLSRLQCCCCLPPLLPWPATCRLPNTSTGFCAGAMQGSPHTVMLLITICLLQGLGCLPALALTQSASPVMSNCCPLGDGPMGGGPQALVLCNQLYPVHACYWFVSNLHPLPITTLQSSPAWIG
jgi:hypothetical protein